MRVGGDRRASQKGGRTSRVPAARTHKPTRHTTGKGLIRAQRSIAGLVAEELFHLHPDAVYLKGGVLSLPPFMSPLKAKVPRFAIKRINNFYDS